jgi:gas vesicle protein
MWINLLKTCGYMLAAKETIGMLSRSGREEELRRSQNFNMLLGITFGTAIGITTGLLVAPRSGRETRDRIALHAHMLMEQMKESAHSAKKDLERDPRIRSTVRSAREAGEAVRKEAEKTFG